MKKALLLSFVFVSICFHLFAAVVAPDHAKQVAMNFYAHQTGKAVTTADLVFTVESANTQGATSVNEPACYIFNINGNEGFVIISAEDLVTPVLAYDNTAGFNTNKISPEVNKWMEGYKSQIINVRYNLTATTTEIANKWNDISHNRFAPSTRSVGVTPLVHTNWDQDPFVNALCPYDNSARTLTVTGCVATCMAQLMRYWSFPPQGIGYHSYNDWSYGTQSADFGSTTYDWANMPYNIIHSDTAAAILMYHCGVAVEMSYGTAASGGSGAYVLAAAAQNPDASSEYAYVNYFGYDGNTLHGYFRNSYADADWIGMMKTELDAGRPFQYVGSGSVGGHTWVCDGYDANDMFHMNWGWGGSSNGYFSVDALNPASLGAGGGNGGFNYGHQILIGLQPPTAFIQSSLALTSAIVANPNPYTIGSALDVTATVTNNTANDFHGAIAAQLFTSTGVFVKNIEEKTGQSITAGSTVNYTFHVDSLNNIPGSYRVGIYYKTSYQNQYTAVLPDTFVNPINLVFAGSQKNIQLISAISGDTIIATNQPFQEFVKLVNNGTRDFSGSVRAALYNANDSLVLAASVIANTTIPAGGNIRNFVFSATGASLAPGTYYLAIETYDLTSGAPYWVAANNDLYTNPITVRAVVAPLAADVYEANNLEAGAYTFTPGFVAGVTEVLTTGSNIHIASDNDYYKIVLPAGSTYTITARVNDSQQSTDGGTYTNDVVFSYKTAGTWSATYDQEMPAPITCSGGAVLFHVSDFQAGTTGTYVLDVNIRQSGSVGIANTVANDVMVYPNPATDNVTIDAGSLTGKCQFTIVDMLGKSVLTKDVELAEGQLLTENLSTFDNGMYVLQLKSDGAVHEAKIVVNR